MTPHITAFIVDRIKGTDEGRLRCRVKWDGSRNIVAFSVGYKVSIARWDADAQRCVPRSFHGKYRVPASDINAEIERYKEAVDASFRDYALRGEIPTAEQLRDDVPRRLGASTREKGVFQAFDEYLAECSSRNRWKDTTLRMMRVVKAHLMSFKEDLRWEDFNEKGLYNYINYLRTGTKPRKGCQEGKPGLSDLTVEKQIARLRWFLRWADARGYLTIKDYMTFKPRLQKAAKPIIFLDWRELMKVYNFEIPPARRAILEVVRDFFCFCAFTSLRYSDAAALTWSDVGPKAIRVTTQKTTDAVEIELNKFSREIIMRYAEVEVEGNRVFPIASNQKTNVHLKELMKLAGIDSPVRVTTFRDGVRKDKIVPKWELIGTHAARRSFISNALTMGIPPSVVMQWTGHSDYDAMKPYIAIASSAKAREMAKFDELGE